MVAKSQRLGNVTMLTSTELEFLTSLDVDNLVCFISWCEITKIQHLSTTFHANVMLMGNTDIYAPV